jgi:hypothetical protein
MTKNKIKIKSTLIKPPYQWRTTEGTAVYDYRSAHTKINPNWRWWKPWINRFLSVPAGWRLLFSIKGKIELNIKPTWY